MDILEYHFEFECHTLTLSKVLWLVDRNSILLIVQSVPPCNRLFLLIYSFICFYDQFPVESECHSLHIKMILLLIVVL